MDPAIVRRLVDLDQEFYERFAAEFSASRARLNDGILRVLGAMQPLGRLLDVGCGDARVGHAWSEGVFAGPVDYCGVDRSENLLRARGTASDIDLVRRDLTESGWLDELLARLRARTGREGFDTVICFSVLHHVPSRAARVRLLRDVAAALHRDGQWALSVWQVSHLERFRARQVPFASIGIGDDEVESGDLLLDWRRGGRGLRYVHEYTFDELREDCGHAGLDVREHFRSDGRSGDLGLYVRGSGVAVNEWRSGNSFTLS